jgi:hypothetical protein
MGLRMKSYAEAAHALPQLAFPSSFGLLCAIFKRFLTRLPLFVALPIGGFKTGVRGC